jgi:malate synthase
MTLLEGSSPLFVKLIRRFLSKIQKRRINLTKKRRHQQEVFSSYLFDFAEASPQVHKRTQAHRLRESLKPSDLHLRLRPRSSAKLTI